MAATTRPGPKRKPLACRNCNGTGSVVAGTDERGRPITETCNQCQGAGEL